MIKISYTENFIKFLQKLGTLSKLNLPPISGNFVLKKKKLAAHFQLPNSCFHIFVHNYSRNIKVITIYLVLTNKKPDAIFGMYDQNLT